MTKRIAIFAMLLLLVSHVVLAMKSDNIITLDNFKKTYPTVRYEDAIVEMAKPLDIELNNERYLCTCHVIFGSESKDTYAWFNSFFRYQNSQWVEIKRVLSGLWDASDYYRSSMPTIELIEYKGQKYISYLDSSGRGPHVPGLYKINGSDVTALHYDLKAAFDFEENQLRSNETLAGYGGDIEIKNTEISSVSYIQDKASACRGCKAVAKVIITYDIIGDKIIPIKARRIDLQGKSN